ncbi:kinase-like domain-containing protein [Mycena olivaceomarginata]|nr:kinase-like domain-containing protein [Mycena olivaceomarginata]
MPPITNAACVLAVFFGVSVGCYLHRIRSRPAGFPWRSNRYRDSEPDWDQFRDFLSQHGLALYSFAEFHDPTPVTQLALDPSGREVIIKAVPSDSMEAQILERLASPPFRDNPENHTVPVVSILHCDPATFLVQARWGDLDLHRYPSSLNFWAGTQAYQLLQGLNFMHEHGVAHGDIYRGNIVCNFTGLRTGTVFDKFKTSGSYRLAFIDFGAAMQCDSIGPHCISSTGRRHCPPPEFRAPELDSPFFDPFSADVFSLARLLVDLDPPHKIPAMYQSLLDDMTNPNPTDRPTASGRLMNVR